MTGNLLFITADQWRGDCLSALSHPVVRTPNLDALAAQGLLFARHFVNTAPCGPSRASIHTGRYQRYHGVAFNGTPLAAEHGNWALEMRRRDIAPALFGFTDTTGPAPDEPWDGVLPGLEPVVRLGKMTSPPSAWMAWLRDRGYPVPEEPLKLYTATAQAPSDEPPALAVPAELHDTWFLVDQAIDHIERQDAPWCVHLSLLRPHPPWTAPAPYHDMYPPNELPPFARAERPELERDQHPYLDQALTHRHSAAPADEARLRRWQAGYYGLMTEVDHNLGRLFDALKRADQWRRTLIVFTSDHGEQMGDHWLIGKLGFFDASFQVPMIVFNPLAAADAWRGARIDAFTEAVDIMPTLLEWMGIDAPPECDGRSLLPMTTAGRAPADWRRHAQWEFHYGKERRLHVERGEDWKRVRFDDPDGLSPIEYDLASDPLELDNLA